MDILVAIAALIIAASTIWAALSESVRDGIPLKLSLALTGVSAYFVVAQTSERTLGMLVVSIAAVCASSTYQRYVQKHRLFHRPEEKKHRTCHKKQRHARAA